MSILSLSKRIVLVLVPLLPTLALGQPLVQQEFRLKVVGVDQTGKPPYTPEGRVYRIAGDAVTRLKPGDILTLQRPREERTIGTLRIISVQMNSATARLENRGEIFPLIGDVALPLAAVGMPGVSVPPTKGLKIDFKYPMQPVVLPQMASQTAIESKSVLPPDITKPYQEIVSIVQKIQDSAQQGAAMPSEKPVETPTQEPYDPTVMPKIADKPPTALKPVLPPEITKPYEEIVEITKKIEDDIQKGGTGAEAPKEPEVIVVTKQNAFYFQPGSSALSPIGRENLKKWTQEWGTNGATYYLKVPAGQLKLEKILLDRLQALEKELVRLGVANVEYRAAEDYYSNLAAKSAKQDEPFETIFVGADISSSVGSPLDPTPSIPLAAQPPLYALDEPQPEIVEQFPIYFLPSSSVLSPKGVERLRLWVQGWGTKGTKYFLSVPQDQIKLDKLLIERVAALQKELAKLGVSEADIRPDEGGKQEPYETIYLGVEVWKKK